MHRLDDRSIAGDGRTHQFVAQAQCGCRGRECGAEQCPRRGPARRTASISECRDRGLPQHNTEQVDILASTLAAKYNICAPEDAHFPISKSEAAFRAPGGKPAQFVSALPPIERSRLEALKPYQGGNADLWSLHRLDIMRKHRRLLTVVAEPDFFSVEGPGIHLYFTPAANTTSWRRGFGVPVLLVESILFNRPTRNGRSASFIRSPNSANGWQADVSPGLYAPPRRSRPVENSRRGTGFAPKSWRKFLTRATPSPSGH